MDEGRGVGGRTGWVCERGGKKLGERIFLRKVKTQQPTATPEQAKTAHLASGSVVPGIESVDSRRVRFSGMGGKKRAARQMRRARGEEGSGGRRRTSGSEKERAAGG